MEEFKDVAIVILEQLKAGKMCVFFIILPFIFYFFLYID